MDNQVVREAGLRLAAAVQARVWALSRKERGDMPGWVLIAVMTAGLVAIIYGVAQGPIRELVREALSNPTE